MTSLVLSIDTSCDDTSAAVVCGREICSNIIASQTDLHRPYGGVFPTVAKQAHRENIEPTVRLALKRAGLTMEQIEAVAVTIGPGLAPALEVGIEYAKQLAEQYRLPLFPVNHIEGHLLSVLAQPRSRDRRQVDPNRLHQPGPGQELIRTKENSSNSSHPKQTSNSCHPELVSGSHDIKSATSSTSQKKSTVSAFPPWQTASQVTSPYSSFSTSNQGSFHSPSLPALGMVVSGGNTLFVLIEPAPTTGFQWLGGGLPETDTSIFTSTNSTFTINSNSIHTTSTNQAVVPDSNPTVPNQLHSNRVSSPTQTRPSFPDRCPRLGLDVSPLFPEQPWLNSGQFAYTILGQTLDDAAGECLDKVGRMLNLGYPAAPVIEQLAKQGNPTAYQFPLPMTTTQDFNLSFSGIKTFARRFIAAEWSAKPPTKQNTYDFCASLQYAVFRHISYKLSKILVAYPQIQEVWLGGGVAANMTLRKMIRQTLRKSNTMQSINGQSVEQPMSDKKDFDSKNLKNSQTTRILRVPYTKKLCMDNAGMGGITLQNQLWSRLLQEN